MTKLRLAIVRQKYSFDGGAEKFIYRFLEAFKHQKIDINIITRYWPHHTNYIQNVHICNPKIWNRLSRDRGFSKSVQKFLIKENFDVIQSHEPIMGCDIFRAGDGVHQVWLNQRARIQSLWGRCTTKLSPYHHYLITRQKNIFYSSSVKAIICNSNMVKQDILQCFSIQEKKIHVIYNSIDTNIFKPAAPEWRFHLRKKLHLPMNAIVMIYVGSGFERKGLKNAIQGIANTDRYLIIVGRDKKLTDYQKLAKELGCLNRMRFVGVQKDVRPFYYIADALLLPTLYDPFPNVILEAMACGLPVITSNTCGGAELIRNGYEGFICDALDIKSIHTAILDTPSILDNCTMSKLARLKIQTFTPEYLVKKFIELYKKIL